MSRPTILLLGDSLTQLAFEGWGAKLAHVYQRRADVLNRGCSGYNTEFYMRLLPLPHLVDDVCLVTIFFGANDASLPNENPHHYVSLSDYSQNLKTLVARVRDKYGSKTRILLMAPPPLDHEQRLVYQKKRYGDRATGVLERTNENTQRYARTCVDVANELDVPCLDLFTAMMMQNNNNNDDADDDDPDKNNYGRFLCDGLHFSAAGHDFVGDQVVAAIGKHFPELAVTPCAATGQFNNSGSHCPALSSLGPYHDEIDHTDIDKAFT